jgi:hypothetical protein
VIQWNEIADFVEPDWERAGTTAPPSLFWRPKKGATFGYIRDGELFDAKWIYVSDSNKVSHFSLVEGPGDNVVDLAAHRAV